MTTPGRPENVYPATSNGQPGVTRRQCRPIWYQTPGMDVVWCGSLASSGLPLTVSAPETTHAFDPTPAPWPSSAGTAFTAVAAEANASWTAAAASTPADDDPPVDRDVDPDDPPDDPPDDD